MIIIFTGNGKGKTTAAIGQAIRALGHGKRVLIIQFIKGDWETGEEKIAKELRSKNYELRIIKTGRGFVRILNDQLLFSAHKATAQKGLKIAARAIKSKKWDLIILDEINVAVSLKLIKASQVLKMLKDIQGVCVSPRRSTSSPRWSAPVIIITGRGAPKSFIKVADLVTEMKEVKHPFRKGKVGIKGIEF